MNAPFKPLTRTELAIRKRQVALKAVGERFDREAEHIPLSDWKARLRLSHEMQGHIDEIEKEYRKDMRIALDKAVERI